MADDPWKQQVEAFGQFIHTQRKADPRLSESQKEALLAVYRGFARSAEEEAGR